MTEITCVKGIPKQKLNVKIVAAPRNAQNTYTQVKKIIRSDNDTEIIKTAKDIKTTKDVPNIKIVKNTNTNAELTEDTVKINYYDRLKVLSFTETKYTECIE